MREVGSGRAWLDVRALIVEFVVLAIRTIDNDVVSKLRIALMIMVADGLDAGALPTIWAWAMSFGDGLIYGQCVVSHLLCLHRLICVLDHVILIAP